MRILFYNSSNMGAVNEYNISKVIEGFPEAEFSIVTVVNRKKQPTAGQKLIHRLKQAYYEFKNGRDKLRKHNRELDEKLRKEIDYTLFQKVPVTYVQQVNDIASETAIKEFGPDIILQCGAGILKPNIFSLAKVATINVHHGLAPEIRGMQSTLWCLYYGLTDKIGVTCHHIDETLDTGKIILQYRCTPAPSESYQDIQFQLSLKGAELLLQSIRMLDEPHDFVTDEIDSFYFSHFDYLKYNELLKNSFKPVKDPEELKKKKKVKNIYRSLKQD